MESWRLSGMAVNFPNLLVCLLVLLRMVLRVLVPVFIKSMLMIFLMLRTVLFFLVVLLFLFLVITTSFMLVTILYICPRLRLAGRSLILLGIFILRLGVSPFVRVFIALVFLKESGVYTRRCSVKLSMFSVQDSKAGVFLSPFPAANSSVALRQFSDAVQNPESVLRKHPEDYALFELGTFDDQSGRSVNLDVPKMIGTANQYLVS